MKKPKKAPPLPTSTAYGYARVSTDGQTGDRVVTASEDKTARIWDARTGKPIGEPMRHKGSVLTAAFDVAGDRVVSASEDNTARIWDARTVAKGQSTVEFREGS